MQTLHYARSVLIQKYVKIVIMGLYELRKEVVALLIPVAIIIWAINLKQWAIAQGAIIFGLSEGAMLGYLKLREERKKNQEIRLTKLNDGVFKRWMKFSKNESKLFYIEISIDENIDKVLLKDAIGFLESKRKKYGNILELKKTITELKKNYNRIGEDIIPKINAQFSIAYPSLKYMEARKVTGSENCYVIEAINFLIWYRLKKNFLKTGLVKWDNILLEENYEDNMWRLMSNFAWKFFIQSKNKSDVNEKYFMTQVENIIIKKLSEDLKQQSKLYEELNQHLTEFKDKVHGLSIDIELNRV